MPRAKDKLIKTFYKAVKGKIPIIGVGGVNSGQDVFDKMTSGASLTQLYTGLVYEGPLVVKKIKSELIEILHKQKIKKISEIVGAQGVEGPFTHVCVRHNFSSNIINQILI
mgnify:CR=1 FL=1